MSTPTSYNELIHVAKTAFESAYGTRAEICAVAPSRINLIGEHTDYNDGFVLPMAIQLGTVALVRRGGEGSNSIRLISLNSPGKQLLDPVNIELAEMERVDAVDNIWVSYVHGVLTLLQRDRLTLVPLDIIVYGNVPIGSGLSSSSSLTISVALAVDALLSGGRSRVELAQICQCVEHEFIGVPCGIMDQIVIATAIKNHALLLDCRSLETRQISMVENKDIAILVCNTNVKHALAEGQYAARRQQCIDAVQVLRQADSSITSLRDIMNLDFIDKFSLQLGEELCKRARHVVSENFRTLQFSRCLKENDIVTAGKLALESHRSLQHQFQVSCDELDFVVDHAVQLEGVYGARMTGGGFGGCVIIFLLRKVVDSTQRSIESMYKKRFGVSPSFILCTSASKGAHIVEV